jgi:ActR/RegA family two-component response regulator
MIAPAGAIRPGAFKTAAPPFRPKLIGLPPSVLIVEDNRMLAAQVETWIEEEGFDVAGQAYTVGAAIRLVESRRPALAMVDMNLGGEFAHPVIARLAERRARVIIMTGYSDVCEIGASIAAVIRKPFTRHDVVAALRLAGLPN